MAEKIKTKTTVLLDAVLWKRFSIRMHELRDIKSQSRAIEVALEEWLDNNQEEPRQQKVPKPPAPKGSAGKTTLENQPEITVLLTSLVEQTESIRQSQTALAQSQTVLTKKLTGLSSEVAVVKTEIAGISAAWHEQTIAEQEELNRAPGDLKDNRNRLRADRNKLKEDKKNGETGEDSALPGTGTA